MPDPRIVAVEWAQLEGRRPRPAGCNARLGPHGRKVRVPLARLTTSAGVAGFGRARITEAQATQVLGQAVSDLVDSHGAVREPFRAFEYPLLDLAGRLAGMPVYALLGGHPDGDGTFRAPCYDTSLYMDDLHLQDDGAAAALIAEEAMQGYARGHRAFKIKVGRGAMHMPLEAGTRRDVRVIRAVRTAVGPGARIMIDANNGYNLNLAKRVLSETADATVYWIEEAFHEDVRLYKALKGWLSAEGLGTLIADGEGAASPHLLDWAKQGTVDVIQYDVLRPGFSYWLELGPQLDAAGVRSAPHHYGEPYANYAAAHLAARIARFEGVEWDEASVPGLDASAYAIDEGQVLVPNLPGFGLALDEAVFDGAVRAGGFAVGIV
jgi:L-rhamnonate dehydratase